MKQNIRSSYTKDFKLPLKNEVTNKKHSTKDANPVTVKQKSSFMFNRTRTLRLDDLINNNTAYGKKNTKSKANTKEIIKPAETQITENNINDNETDKRIEELASQMATIKELIEQKDNEILSINKDLDKERKITIKLAEENAQLVNQQEEQRKYRENYFEREVPKIQQIYNEMIQQACERYEARQLEQFYPDIDNMTQEEILRLQMSIGFVQNAEEVDKISQIQEEKYDILKFKKKNYIRECTICQEEFTEGEVLKKLNCNHYYHKHCIKDWLLYNKKCPLCKNEI